MQNGSRYWQMRAHVPVNGQKYQVKSSKTTDYDAAVKQAQQFYLDCLQWQRGEIALPARLVQRSAPERRFDNFVDVWLDEFERDANTDRKRRDLADKRSICLGRTGFVAFFGKDDIGAITTDRIREYLRFKDEGSGKGQLATASKRRNLVTLNVLLGAAKRQGLILSVPKMPVVKLEDSPRTWLNHEEYDRLRTTANKLARPATESADPKNAAAWAEMHDFTTLMVNGFFRSSEWPHVQHRHVEVDSVNNCLRIAVARAKTRQRYTISMPEAVPAYRRIIARNGLDPNSYLFLPDYLNRNTAKARMRDRFHELLTQAGLKVDALDRNRVINCLRHSSIMFRLIAKVPIKLIATNAGTSVAIIDRFYGSHYTADMNIPELHMTPLKQLLSIENHQPQQRSIIDRIKGDGLSYSDPMEICGSDGITRTYSGAELESYLKEKVMT